MKTTLMITLLSLIAVPAFAQEEEGHSDIEFTYEDGKIDIEFGDEGPIFESEFPTEGAFAQFTDEPGMEASAEEGNEINPGDLIDYNVLGPLVYHDGSGFTSVPDGVGIRISDNPSGDWLVDGSLVGPLSGPGLIDQADAEGEIHSHVEFALEPADLGSDAYGAYGILMELTTDEPGIANSDPFYIIFNFGMEEEAFEGTVGDFAAAVPEPSGALLGLLSLGAFVAVRRKARA